MIRFGNDGWKTRYEDGFNADNCARVADALGALWSKKFPGASVYVGYDTRLNSGAIAARVASTISACGLDAKLSEVACPTPALALACANDPDSAGAVMITASELSCEYGGLLVRGSDGGPCGRDFLNEVEQLVPSAAPTGGGEASSVDVVGPYLSDIAEKVKPAPGSLKVVVDPMYGSAAGTLSKVLRERGCDVVEIHSAGLGDFGGIHPSPTDPWADECERTVVDVRADLGILLDCDGDRAAVVDERGRLLAVREFVPLVLAALDAHGVPQGRVVATLTSSSLIERQAERLGLGFTPVSVGFPYIYAETEEGDVVLGAEEYGGICVPGHLRERDGIFACLLLVDYLQRSGSSLSGLVERLGEELGRTCWLRRDVRLDPAAAAALRAVLPGLNPGSVAGAVPVEVCHADGLRLSFGDGSWALARPARSAPAVRVYAEAASAAGRDALLEGLLAAVAGACGA